MTDGLLLQILALVVLIACSALLTGAEAAYFSLGRARLRRLTGKSTGGTTAPTHRATAPSPWSVPAAGTIRFRGTRLR